MTKEKAELALEFLKHFYVSDISDELREKAEKILLDYFKNESP